ncbi:hypothetical protein [Lysobacter brunescens]|uniref:YbjN domain-containing protein n=1 Tax=Lysobacter brunescens TaxID=262323 RepID=A0ABW2YAU3_9GAMM
MDPTLWNLLHDGKIERIEGTLPGDVSVHVRIGYLRKGFPGAGTGFVVHLSDCSQLTFTPHDQPGISDFSDIAALRPWIVDCEPSNPIEVHCAEGTLTLRYDTAALSLDSGETITLSQLDAAATAYWDAWSARHKATRQTDQ